MEDIVMEEIDIYIALGVIWRRDLGNEIRREILVQCEERDFYCLPGGRIRQGKRTETEEDFLILPGGSRRRGQASYEDFIREIKEQYSLKFGHYGTFMEFEMPPPVRCKYIFHKCMLDHKSQWDSNRMENIEFPHNNYKDIKLVWCSVDDLYDKLAYPNSLLQILIEKLNTDDEGYIYTPGYD
jgi:hypothetical protein